MSQWQLRDVGVISQLSSLGVEGEKSFVEEDAVGGLLGDQAVGQEVPSSVPLGEPGDDLFELARVGVRPLGSSPRRGLCSFEPLFHCYNNRLQGSHYLLTSSIQHIPSQSPSPVGLLRDIVVPVLGLPIHVFSELLVGAGNFCRIVRAPILLWPIVIVALRFLVVVGLGLGLGCDRGWRGVDIPLIEVDPVELVLAVEGSRAIEGRLGRDEGVVNGVSLQFGEFEAAGVGAVLVGSLEAVYHSVFVCECELAIARVSWRPYFRVVALAVVFFDELPHLLADRSAIKLVIFPNFLSVYAVLELMPAGSGLFLSLPYAVLILQSLFLADAHGTHRIEVLQLKRNIDYILRQQY